MATVFGYVASLLTLQVGANRVPRNDRAAPDRQGRLRPHGAMFGQLIAAMEKTAARFAACATGEILTNAKLS